MRTATAIRTGLVLAVAVVLGLMAAPAAQALWSVFVPSNAGTIQAADFSVQLTGSPLNATQEMVLEDGTPATIALTGTGGVGKLSPGASVTAAVQVANTTNAGSDFTIRITLPVQAEIAQDLANHLTLTYANASSLAECSTVTYAPRGQLAMDIPKGKWSVLCFRIELSSSAPSTVSGQSGSISVPLQANQR